MNTGSESNERRIYADATKDFFVNMITRDISLRDCIFDLLDNSIDGARRSLNPQGGFDDYAIHLSFSSKNFEIKDNCGGIRLSDAIDYAFHFGRKPASPSDVKGGIGLYGIGMKRAIFKIGRLCNVFSEADDATFTVRVDVDQWKNEASWDFYYEDAAPVGKKGTKIEIEHLNEGVSQMLGDPAFKNELIKEIARDYAFFIQKGLKIFVGNNPVPSYKFQLRTSESLAPFVSNYEDGKVNVRIFAGLVDDLPTDIPDELRPSKVERFGWFVVCNDRIVLSADKTDRTIWGDEDYQIWHPQYNGFAGFIFFHSSDQRELPWTTTKRDLDATSPLYRRAVTKMKSVTTPFIKYTNDRKLNIDAAKRAEAPTRNLEISELKQVQPLRLPTISTGMKSDDVTISFKKPKREVEDIRKHEGNPTLSAKDVGILAFEYYQSAELGK
jgi:hypothetical protein